MNKFQIAVLALLALIACAVIAAIGIVYYSFSVQEVAEAPPASPSPTPASTATPTITPTPLELPTSAAQAEATATNTPVVAATPSPTPGKSFGQQLTGHTREPGQNQDNTEAEQSTAEANVRFWADSTSLQAGACTNLHWSVEGVAGYWIDGQPGAGPTGELHICPSRSETHILKYDETVNGLLRSKEIQVAINVAAPPQSDSSGSSGGSSGSGSGTTGGGSSNVVANLSTGNGATGLSGTTRPYAISVKIYKNNDVLIAWSGCGAGGETAKLRGNKVEFKKGNPTTGPYFLISATWEKSDNSMSGRTEMFSVNAASGRICVINDVFIMR